MLRVFSHKQFNKKLISLVAPIALSQLMLAAVSALDALMLGAISQDKMAAVSLAAKITFVENLFLAAMTIGLSMLAAQYWGKGDKGAFERIFAYVMRITVIVGFMFFITAQCFPQFLMMLLTNEPTLIEGGGEYLRLVAPSYLLSGISQIYFCAFKNSGRAKKAGVISFVCMAFDVVMNSLLILGLLGMPRLEIAGAAISTTLARAVEVLWCCAEGLKGNSIKLRLKNILKADRVLRGDFWKYTTPVLLNEIVWGVGFTMSSVIMGHLGSDAVAASSVADIVKNLVSCLCLGVGSGGGIIIGNELGAGRLDRAKKYGDRLCVIATAGGVLSGLVLMGISPVVLSLVNLNSTAQGYLKEMLIICSCYMIGKSVNSTTIAGIFTAGGDSKFGFICDTVVMWCIIVPMGLISAFIFKLPVITVYFILSLDELLKLPAVYINYKKYNWVNDLTKGEDVLNVTKG